MLLESEDKQFVGEFPVDGEVFDRLRKGKAYKQLSIITNSRDCVRFSEESDPDNAIDEINKTAKKLSVLTAIAFLFILLSSVFLSMPLFRTIM